MSETVLQAGQRNSRHAEKAVVHYANAYRRWMQPQEQPGTESDRLEGKPMVLHGTWIPSNTGGSFFIWGEMKAGTTSAVWSADAGAPTHPFTAPPAFVFLALQDQEAVVTGSIPVAHRVGVLPSSGESPLPSPLFSAYHEIGDWGDAALAPWLIEGIELGVDTALPLLASRINEDFDGRPGLLIADDLRYWSQPALLAIEILARQRFVPTLLKDGGTDQPIPLWRPILGDTEVANRVVTLAENMPSICRAFSNPPQPVHNLLASFLTTTVDSSIKRWSQAMDLPLKEEAEQQRGSASSSTDDLIRWVAALLGRPTDKGTGIGTITYREVLDWTAAVRMEIDRSGARTCLRLDPPGNELFHNPREPDAWALSYHLQAADDPAVIVQARVVWRERGEVMIASGRRLHHPQEKLLGDLGRAARLFSPIERSLRRRRPEAVSLRPDLTYKFLSEGAPLLRESGFGIFLPASLDPATAVRLGIRGKFSAEPAPLSMDMPVNFDWELAIGNVPIDRKELESLAEKPVPLIEVDGRWVLIGRDEVATAMRLLATKRTATITLRDALRMGGGKGATVAGLPVTGAVATGWLDELLSKLANPERLVLLKQPAAFVGELRPYQERGFSWLDFLSKYGLGACLADDMGLGKTIQMIALLLYQQALAIHNSPTLLICPTSVLGNWERELKRFAPSLTMHVHHGGSRLKGIPFREAAMKVDVVLSTFSLLARDISDLTSMTWNGFVLDEAQNIKNHSTKQWRAARSIKGHYRVALTGTPVENHPGELWSILEFLNPGYLGKAPEFRRRFYLPIKVNRDRRAIEQLQKLVQPFMLRRLKTDKDIIQDLPEKHEMKVYCGLTKEQAALYKAIESESMKKISGSIGIQRKGAILAAIVRLKQVCNHPAHLLNDGTPIPDRSGKLIRLEEMVEEALEEGDHMLIFTQFKIMGDILTRHLQNRFGREVLFLHGGIEAKHRTRMVERFEEEENGPQIFVLSLKAGGTGLNLERANRVFHFDRWWNPAVENQATDRAFRIGQTRDVMVHKFVCAGTVEEKIDALIESKKQMADGLIGAGENWLTEYSTDELATMFTLQKDAVIEI